MCHRVLIRLVAVIYNLVQQYNSPYILLYYHYFYFIYMLYNVCVQQNLSDVLYYVQEYGNYSIGEY